MILASDYYVLSRLFSSQFNGTWQLVSAPVISKPIEPQSVGPIAARGICVQPAHIFLQAGHGGFIIVRVGGI